MNLAYDITVTGEQNIRRVLRGVEAEIASSSKRAQASAGRMPGSATARRSTERDAAQASRRIERDAIAGQKRIEREEVASAKRTERERIASEKRVERERIASERQVGREQQKQERYWADARAKSRTADRQAHEATLKNRAATAASVGGGIANSVRGAIGTVAGIGGSILGVAGLAGAGEAVNQEIDIDRRVRQAVVNARQPGEAGMSPGALRGRVRETSVASGVSENSLVGAVETYTARTGDIKTATDNLRTFATVAMATGASVEDVASTAADLAQKFNINSPKEMADAFAVLAFQGKKGAFELRDMASTFPEMAAAAQRAGMTGVGGMRTLGGLAQLARTSTGSGAEASTALQMMMTQLIAKAGDLKSGKALGGRTVKVFEGGDATKPARDIREVLAEIISRSHGNLTQLGELFDVRGVRAASPLITAYRTAAAGAGGGTKGEAAGKLAVLKAISEASDAVVSYRDVQRDAAEVAQSDSAKLEAINTKLREAFSSKLLPVMERMMPKFEELIPKIAEATGAFAEFISWFAGNPIKGLGAVVLAKVGADLALAGIGAGVKAALVALVGTSAGATAAGSAAATAAAPAVATGATAAAGAGLGGAAIFSGFAAAAGAVSLGAYALDKQTDGIEKETDPMGNPVAVDMTTSAADQRAAAKMQLEAAKSMGDAARTLAAAKGAESRSKPIVAR